MYVMCNLFL